MAKIKYIPELVGVNWAEKTPYIVQCATSLEKGTTYTLLDISGSGYFFGMYMFIKGCPGAIGIRITVDSQEIQNDDTRIGGLTSSTDSQSFFIPYFIPFKNSLQIVLKNTSSSYDMSTVSAVGQYILD